MPEPDDDSSAAATVTYELRLTGGGVAVERQVSEAKALQIVSLVMGGEPAPRAASTAPPSSRAAHRGSLATTVGECLDEVEAKRNLDKIVAIGAFLVDHLGKESFTREVKARFQHAGGTPSANFARGFSLAVSNKWIAQAPGSAGNYSVTNTGRKAIADNFAGETRKFSARVDAVQVVEEGVR